MKEHEAALEKNHQQECKFAAEHYLEDLNKVKIQYEKKKQELVEAHQKEIQQIKEEIGNLEAIYKEKERLWDERGRRMLELYERRESKKEDVKAIEQLEVELLKRDFMIEKERSELKYCKLEL
jgi:hypothetical protein